MAGVSKTEADAHDKLMDAASELADLIAESGLDLGEKEIEDVSLFLAKNAPIIRDLLRRIPAR